MFWFSADETILDDSDQFENEDLPKNPHESSHPGPADSPDSQHSLVSADVQPSVADVAFDLHGGQILTKAWQVLAEVDFAGELRVKVGTVRGPRDGSGLFF